MGFVGAVVLGVIWVRKAKSVLSVLVLLLAAVPAAFFLPSRQVDAVSLRNRYVRGLESFAGSTYVWGGEGRLGIDCSGLPRKAYRDAALIEGLRTFNGALTRQWLDLWWNDAGAKTMAGGHEGRLVEVSHTEAADLPVDKLQAGDIAVVNGDTHVLVYLGNRQWMEADPGCQKVILHDQQADPAWLPGVRPRIMRWRSLMETR